MSLNCHFLGDADISKRTSRKSLLLPFDRKSPTLLTLQSYQMTNKGGYRAAIRDRLRNYGIICEVLYEYKHMMELQELIYINWISVFVSNEMKSKTLNSLFYRGPNDSEADIFERIVPWHALDKHQKANYKNLLSWIKCREYECC